MNFHTIFNAQFIVAVENDHPETQYISVLVCESIL
jgi:hypothetical protein